MGSISAIHGITLSAWAFAGLTGNQMATFIVNHTGKFESHGIDKATGKEILLNPQGYQNVLYATIALYIIALLLSLFFVQKSGKALEAKKAE